MNHPSLSFCYAILCGGQSRRMGQDKSLLTVDGQSIIERVVNDLKTSVPIQTPLLMCSASKRYSQLANDNLHYLDDYGGLSGAAFRVGGGFGVFAQQCTARYRLGIYISIGYLVAAIANLLSF